MVQKTKPRAEGGRQLVSVGPYIKAVGPQRYAVITKQDVMETLSPTFAAKEFISFVGRDRAAEALQRPRCPRRVR